MNKKKTFIILILIIFMIFLLFFLINYKTGKYGNNISKSTDDIVRYILNISSYEAEIEVTVESNKTINKYKMQQFFSNPNIMKQIIKEPTNIENLTITYDGYNMKLDNTKLSLSKIYENYKYISENTLWLSTFINNYNKNSKVEEIDNKIIIENNIMLNNHKLKQILYIDKKTALPIKLEIKDNNKKNKIYIKYNEIKLNKTNKDAIIAFKIEKNNL